MATTQIPPPQSPATAHVEPVLLVQLQDELARSRRREAFWISIIVHVAAVIAILALPPLFPERQPFIVATAGDVIRDRDVRFLALPPDLAPQPAERPKTNILSDKDRIASSRSPQPEPDALRDGFRPGPPAPPVQPSPRPAPASPPQAAQSAGAGEQPAPPSEEEIAQAGQERASQTPPLVAKVEPPRAAPQPGPSFGGGLSAGTAIEQAARAAVSGRGAVGGVGGDFGLGAGSPARMGSNLDILSDTMGVDFGPYLARVLHQVRTNWILLIPEVARAPLMKRGQVSIEFAITKDGNVAGMRLAGPSGDVSLDRAAWGGITASNPFPPLPPQFGGEYLALRFHFYYNPDRSELR